MRPARRPHRCKNFLFCGSNAGGERAASIYSLIGTAKINGLNPEAYLRNVIDRIADHPANRLDELPPRNHPKQRTDAERQTRSHAIGLSRTPTDFVLDAL